jgi:hypothetical protein
LHGWRAASEREGYAWSEAVKSGIEERGEGPLGVVGTEMGPCDEPPPARDWISRGYISPVFRPWSPLPRIMTEPRAELRCVRAEYAVAAEMSTISNE